MHKMQKVFKVHLNHPKFRFRLELKSIEGAYDAFPDPLSAN